MRREWPAFSYVNAMRTARSTALIMSWIARHATHFDTHRTDHFHTVTHAAGR
jgi:hypothetical protein